MSDVQYVNVFSRRIHCHLTENERKKKRKEINKQKTNISVRQIKQGVRMFSVSCTHCEAHADFIRREQTFFLKKNVQKPKMCIQINSKNINL